MASALVWKVYKGKELLASTKYAEEAAAVVALAGEGGTIKREGAVMWREYKDGYAANSYDEVAQTMAVRWAERNQRKLDEWRAHQAAYVQEVKQRNGTTN